MAAKSRIPHTEVTQKAIDDGAVDHVVDNTKLTPSQLAPIAQRPSPDFGSRNVDLSGHHSPIPNLTSLRPIPLTVTGITRPESETITPPAA